MTAQYIAQPLQTTPVSISAVTAQTLEQRGMTSLADLTTSVPALTLKKAPAAFGSAVQAYIRGVGQYDSAFASEPGVGMYIDDEYYGTLFGSNLQLLDLDRVEVLRGPQGVLGGKNNIGGAIRLFTQKPKGDGSGYLQATYGSFNKIDVKGAVDVSIIPDHLFARVTAMSRNQDGYMTVLDYACMNPATSGSLPVRTLRPDCKIGKMGGTNVQGGRIALRAIVNPSIEDNLSVDIIRDNSQTQANTLIAADPGTGSWNPSGDVSWFNGNKVVSVPRDQFFTPRSDGSLPTAGPTAAEAQVLANYGITWDKRFIPANPYRQTYATYTTAQGNNYTEGAFVHSWAINNIFDWDLTDNVHFKNITGYRTYHAGNSADDDVSPVDWGLATSYPYNREFQEEARFTGNLFDGHLDWTLGGFYYHRLNTQNGPVILGAIVPSLVFEQHDKYVTTNKSAYLNVIYHPIDTVDLFGGVRYTKENKTFYFDHSGAVPGYPGSGFFRSTVDPQYSCNAFDPTVPPCDHSISPALQPHTSKTSRPDWRAGVDYHITNDKMVYFSFSTGYRTGGTNSRPFTPAQLELLRAGDAQQLRNRRQDRMARPAPARERLSVYGELQQHHHADDRHRSLPSGCLALCEVCESQFRDGSGLRAGSAAHAGRQFPDRCVHVVYASQVKAGSGRARRLVGRLFDGGLHGRSLRRQSEQLREPVQRSGRAAYRAGHDHGRVAFDPVPEYDIPHRGPV